MTRLHYTRSLTTVIGHPVSRLAGDQRRRYYAADQRERLGPGDLLGATVSVSNIGSLLPGIRGHFAMLPDHRAAGLRRGAEPATH